MCSGPSSPPRAKKLPPAPSLPTTGQAGVVTDDGAGGLARKLLNLTNLGSPFLTMKPTGLNQIGGSDFKAHDQEQRPNRPLRPGASGLFSGVSLT